MSRLKARQPGKALPLEKPAREAAEVVPEAWHPAVGRWCSFYYEGGFGERYWSGGWHHGIIREVPIKGQRKGWMRIELLTDHYATEEDPKTGERQRRVIPHEKPWVFGANVNELGDCTYHGPKLLETVAERAEEKEKECDLLSQLSEKDASPSTYSTSQTMRKTSTSPKPNTKASKKTAASSKPSKVPELTTGKATATPKKSLKKSKPKGKPTPLKKPLKPKQTELPAKVKAVNKGKQKPGHKVAKKHAKANLKDA